MVSFVMLALSASSCGSTEKSVDPPPNALAMVADEPITVEQVRALISDDPLPPVLVAGGYPGPWREALDRAVRDELLGREAARRGIEAPTRAQQIAALIANEQRDVAGLNADAITDDEAKAWYQQNRNIFGNVEEAEVAWAEFATDGQAREVMAKVAGADQPTFQKLVGAENPKETGTATIDHDAKGADPMIARAAFAVATPGKVGLSSDPAERRWWVVRVERISFQEVKWDEALSYRVKSALAAYRQDEHLGKLVGSLRKKWTVRVYEDRLSDITKTEELR